MHRSTAHFHGRTLTLKASKNLTSHHHLGVGHWLLRFPNQKSTSAVEDPQNFGKLRSSKAVCITVPRWCAIWHAGYKTVHMIERLSKLCTETDAAVKVWQVPLVAPWLLKLILTPIPHFTSPFQKFHWLQLAGVPSVCGALSLPFSYPGPTAHRPVDISRHGLLISTNRSVQTCL